MPDFFLDSCLFLAYAYPHETWHEPCVAFFNSCNNRYTGKRVEKEIQIRLERRKQLYIDLMRYLGTGGSPDKFVSTVIKNPNDLRHFREILSQIPSRLIPEVTTYFRDKAEITKKGVKEAFGKIDCNLIEYCDDQICVAIVQTLITNRSDAEILVDALCWSESHPSTFTTLDTTDLIHNKRQVIIALRNYKLLDPKEALSLDIKHLGEVT